MNRKSIIVTISEKGCIEITSHKGWHGYPHLWFNNKRVRAHRFIYEVNFGEIPAGMVVRHTCDNRACINPSHLKLGTSADNVQDKVNRNRQTRGEQIKWSKLTDTDIKNIILSTGQTHKELAQKYNVERSSITRIKNRQTWKHVTV